MKTQSIFFTFLAFLAVGSPAFAQEQSNEGSPILKDSVEIAKLSNTDSIIIEETRTGKKKKISLNFPSNDDQLLVIEKSAQHLKINHNDSTIYEEKTVSKGKPIYGIVFNRLDFGLTKPMQDGGFNLTGENEIFNYRPSKTWNFGFDVLQVGYRFSPSFRTFLSAGFDWTYYRLNKNILFDSESSPYDSYEIVNENLRKNKLTSTYLRLPLTFEFSFPNNSSYFGKTKVAFGPLTGFLLKGTQRYKMENGKKIKEKGDYDFQPFQYGGFVRFGFGHMGIFGKYYVNDVFANAPNDTQLNNFTFGLSLGF